MYCAGPCNLSYPPKEFYAYQDLLKLSYTFPDILHHSSRLFSFLPLLHLPALEFAERGLLTRIYPIMIGEIRSYSYYFSYMETSRYSKSILAQLLSFSLSHSYSFSLSLFLSFSLSLSLSLSLCIFAWLSLSLCVSLSPFFLSLSISPLSPSHPPFLFLPSFPSLNFFLYSYHCTSPLHLMSRRPSHNRDNTSTCFNVHQLLPVWMSSY